MSLVVEFQNGSKRLFEKIRFSRHGLNVFSPPLVEHWKQFEVIDKNIFTFDDSYFSLSNLPTL